MRILVLDQGPITSGNIHYWQAISQLGSCYLPEVVLTEIRRIASDAPLAKENPSEIAAKEFIRFWEISGWNPTSVSKNHPNIVPTAGQDLSRKARLSMAVAQCAYGLASLHPEAMVVLVTEDQTLIRRMGELGLEKLTAASAIAVREWTKTKVPPASVEKVLAPKPRSAQSLSQSGFIKLLSGLTGLLVMIIILMYSWHFINPKRFDKFRQQLKLPPLPFTQPQAR